MLDFHRGLLTVGRRNADTRTTCVRRKNWSRKIIGEDHYWLDFIIRPILFVAWFRRIKKFLLNSFFWNLFSFGCFFLACHVTFSEWWLFYAFLAVLDLALKIVSKCLFSSHKFLLTRMSLSPPVEKKRKSHSTKDLRLIWVDCEVRKYGTSQNK